MLKLDTLNQLKRLKTDIKASRNLMIGTVKGSAHKFGFVSLDSGKDVYLPPDEMEKVLPGDRIEIEVIKDDKNKKVAKIERLISSPIKVFCGKYITKGKAHFIEPDINGMNRWFFVPPQKRKNAQAKDLVKCKITQHPYKTGKAQAAITDIIGTEQDEAIEREYACQKYNIETSWSKAVEEQVSAIDEAHIESKKVDRADFTHLPFVTIDAPTTLDIDDALYAETNEKGWSLYVAIADPCALIETGSAIEEEALRRVSSIYFPDYQVPMLPETLASDLCSLREGEVRLAKVLNIQVNANGELGEYTLKNAFVRSTKKMTYDEVSDFLASASESLASASEASENTNSATDMLSILESATQALLNHRQSTSLVHAERIEFQIELNEKQKIAQILQKKFTVAHRIVEEAMVAANRCIAKLLANCGQDSLFIKHKGIREDRYEALQALLSEQFPEDDIATLPGFIKVMQDVSSSEELNDYHLLMSRQLEKSTFSAESGPHFGMGLAQYTTFTSPLRKAQDFLVHRQLDSYLSENTQAIDASVIASLEERRSDVRGAAYDVEQWLKCQYMAKNKDVFEARVQRTFSTGFHVRLSETGIEGFISTKEMEGKYSFNQERLTLTGKGQAYKLDQVVQVRLKQVDWSRKQLNFEIVEAEVETKTEVEKKTTAEK